MTEFNESLVVWGRYLYWAEINKLKLENLFDSTDVLEKIPTSEFLAYSSLWYGSLFVVIEGWEALNLQDNTISQLLSEHQKLKSLLRRYRNGVYHFQPKLLDDRFVAFGKARDNSYLWARLLHEEFVRYFSDWIVSLPGDQTQKEEIKNSIKEIIGWVPENTFNNRIRSLSCLIQASEEMLNDSEGTQESLSFRNFVESTKELIKESKVNCEKYLAESISSIKSG